MYKEDLPLPSCTSSPVKEKPIKRRSAWEWGVTYSIGTSSYTLGSQVRRGAGRCTYKSENIPSAGITLSMTGFTKGYVLAIRRPEVDRTLYTRVSRQFRVIEDGLPCRGSVRMPVPRAIVRRGYHIA